MCTRGADMPIRDLSVDFGRTMPTPAPGRYTVHAFKTSLDLWTGLHDIRLT